MSAISGLIRFTDGGGDPEPDAQRMIDALAEYGPDARSVRSLGKAAMGRSLYALLPEDAFDQQPLAGAGEQCLLVADLRLDNRPELLAALGMSGDVARLPDSTILLKAYEKWDVRLLDHIVGDFAFAIWDARQAKLILARDPTGQRPLHYYHEPEQFAFASLPAGLHALPRIPVTPDQHWLAEFVTEGLVEGSRTPFEGIRRVEPGQMVTVAREGVRILSRWEPAVRELRLRRFDDYVDAFRAELDQAVSCRLRGTGEVVASHLSSGYDSSAVATTAARLIGGGGKLLAFTSAPRQGFDAEMPRGWFADESPYAAQTAALYPNIEHHIWRPTPDSAFDYLERLHRMAQHPASQVVNGARWIAISERAAARGARVLLTGQLGNITISAPGLWVLSDLIRQGRWAAWWRETQTLVAKGPVRWTGALANSFQPWVPNTVWNKLQQGFIGTSSNYGKPFLLTEEWAARIQAKVGRKRKTPRSSREMRLEAVRTTDPGNFRKASLAGWGIDERDPTADRRLIEFCLSLPPEMLLKDGVSRPLARAALADRIPAEILDNGARGLQDAAWNEHVPREEVRRRIEEIAACPAAAAVINVDQLREMEARWPTGDWNNVRIVQEYRTGLLRALAAGDFVRTAGACAAPAAAERAQ